MKIHIIKSVLFILALTFLLPCVRNPLTESYAQTSLPSQKSYQFINGQWLDGTSFHRRTFYSVNGVLTRKKPAKIDEDVDLKNGYVIPPFAEAHRHKLDIKSELAEQESRFIKEGTIDLLRDKDFQLRNSKSPKELSGFFNISVRYNRKPFDFFDLQTFFTLSRNRFNVCNGFDKWRE